MVLLFSGAACLCRRLTDSREPRTGRSCERTSWPRTPTSSFRTTTSSNSMHVSDVVKFYTTTSLHSERWSSFLRNCGAIHRAHQTHTTAVHTVVERWYVLGKWLSEFSLSFLELVSVFTLTFNGVRRDRKFNVKVGLVLGSCFVGNNLAVVMIAPAGVLGGRKMSQGLQGKYISTTQGSGCTGLGMNE